MIPQTIHGHHKSHRTHTDTIPSVSIYTGHMCGLSMDSVSQSVWHMSI